ncbi:class I SAM-dependent methyltransferase [Corynebacterium epidermidicanis]|uniref:Methyltransferase family protein n=1 Tax=Corynebacterium epidermidicanis TaxID=1050174 RepID=A0A0G3GSR1_9CORY|nr:class I SAM-dependent methyltransferase [Corynebacterium epidermidicanis]AKK04129.1 methyltransferase family protein [Corynebacterium epidermidicanis]
MHFLETTRRRATLHRSLRLLRSFPQEQADPAKFYTQLADDTQQLIATLWADSIGTPPAGASVLDVGGGPGYFERAFAEAGWQYFAVEPSVSELSAAGAVCATTARGDGRSLPFADDCFDVTYSSNVVEHVSSPWDMGEEMLRVTRPGGLVVVSYTVWLGPFGGHETGLWEHYVGGDFARRRYEKRHGHPPKNEFGSSLFAVSCAEGLRWARGCGAEVIGLFPRYHPAWAWWLVRVPVLREFLVSNLVIVLRA